MRLPKSIDMVPRGDWTIIFPGTGHKISSNHPTHFLQLCAEHMRINNIPIVGGWQDQMFSLCCEQNPYLECYEAGEKERRVEGADIWRFVTTLWDAMAAGAVAVSEEEAQRRADICVKCPKMGHTSCGGGCGKLAEVLTTLTLGRKPRNIEAIHKASCGICSCEISSLVNYPLDILHEVDKKVGFVRENYPENCWKYSYEKSLQENGRS